MPQNLGKAPNLEVSTISKGGVQGCCDGWRGRKENGKLKENSDLSHHSSNLYIQVSAPL